MPYSVFAKGLRPAEADDPVFSLLPEPTNRTERVDAAVAEVTAEDPAPTTQPSFGAAFAEARKLGQPTFEYEGKRYHTRTKDEERLAAPASDTVRPVDVAGVLGVKAAPVEPRGALETAANIINPVEFRARKAYDAAPVADLSKGFEVASRETRAGQEAAAQAVRNSASYAERVRKAEALRSVRGKREAEIAKAVPDASPAYVREMMAFERKYGEPHPALYGKVDPSEPIKPKDTRSFKEHVGDLALETAAGAANTAGSLSAVGSLINPWGSLADNKIAAYADWLATDLRGHKSENAKDLTKWRNERAAKAKGDPWREAQVAFENVMDAPLEALASQAANLALMGGAAGVVRGGAAMLKPFLVQTTEKGLMAAGANAAIATGVALQAADVGQDSYERALSVFREKGVPELEAQRQAMAIARVKAIEAGTLAFAGTKFIPGGDTLERALSGSLGKATGFNGLAKTAGMTMLDAGEEGLFEEGPGAVLANHAGRLAGDTKTPLMEGAVAQGVTGATTAGLMAGGASIANQFSGAPAEEDTAPVKNDYVISINTTPPANPVQQARDKHKAAEARYEAIASLPNIAPDVVKQARVDMLTAKAEARLAAATQPTTVQPTAEQQAAVQPTAEQQAAAQPTAVQPAAEQQVAVQPTAAQPTAAQPTTVQPTAVQPAAEQQVAVQPTAAQPTAAQPTAVQPTAVQQEGTKNAEATTSGGQYGITPEDVAAVRDLARGAQAVIQPAPDPTSPGFASYRVADGVERITAEEGRVVNALAKAFGLKATYYDSNGMHASGYFMPNHPDRIFIDVSRDSTSVPVIAGHEVLHAVKRRHRDVYDAMAERILPRIKESDYRKFTKQFFNGTSIAGLDDATLKVLLTAPDIASLPKHLADMWKAEGNRDIPPRELIQEEMLSDLFGNRIVEREFIDGVLQDLKAKHGIEAGLQKFKDFVDDIIHLLTNAINEIAKFATDEAVIDQLDNVRKALRDMATEVIAREQSAALPLEEGAFASPRRLSKTEAAGNRSHRELSPDVALRAEALIDKLVAAASKGVDGKLWYENSAQQVLKLFNGDAYAAENFIRIIAITSANTEVGANMTKAIKAWRQFAAGKPFQVGTGNENLALTKTLYFGAPWGGTKTNTFYINLTEALHGVDSGFSTQDLHMARFAFGKDQPTALEYHILEEATRRAAAKLGVLPRQVQAMVWVPQKADTLISQWEKKGQHKDWSPARKREEAFARSIKDYADMLRERGVKTLEQTEVTRITDDMRRRMTTVIALEAVPTELTDAGAAVAQMPAAARQKFTNHVFNAISPAEVIEGVLNRDDVAIVVDRSEGGYAGRITPNILASVVSRTGKAITRDEIAKVTSALGYVYTQDGVPASRYDDSLRGEAITQGRAVANGKLDPYERTVFAAAVFTLPGNTDGKITLKQEKDFFALIRKHMGSNAGFTRVGPADIVVGNYDADTIDDFHDKASALATAAGLDGFAHTFMEGYYAYTNWEDGRGTDTGRSDGENRSADRMPAFASGSPALSARLDDWRNRAVEATNAWLAENKYEGKPLASPRRSDAASHGRTRGALAGTRENSVQVTGVHYSDRWRSTLDSRFYGTGMPGAEAKRLDDWSATPEQRHRIYFYVDTGAGVFPESGVGSVPHYVNLDNLYDSYADPLGFWADSRAKGGSVNDIINRVEQAIMAAGYDGLYNPNSKIGDQGVAVLLGERRVETSKEPLRSPRRGGFYSTLTEMVERAKQPAMPGQQWKAWINANAQKAGVKLDEIHWTGVLDYLTLRADEKVTREDLAEYLNGNSVKVDTAVKRNVTVEEDDIYVNPVTVGFGPDRFEVISNNEVVDDFESEFEAHALANRLRAEARAGTKYSNYVPPGSTGDYAEILVTLPIEGGTAGTYKSAHWEEPNVLVHLRVDSVQTTDGDALRLIEVQSDWGQQGKKVGFYSKEDAAALAAVREATSNFVEAMKAKYGDAWREKLTLDELDQYDDLVEAAYTRRDGIAVPAAPFVTDTKAWVSLGLKKLIQHAVEQGKDRVVLATGEQNANLYDLSKQIDYIEYEKTGPDEYYIRATDRRGGHPLTEYMQSPAQLENLLGKEVAEKIVMNKGSRDPGDPKEYGLLRTEDLKVGGEGMKAFYDKIVPQVAADVLKKIGGGKLITVSGVDSNGGTTYKGFDITPAMRATVESGMPLMSPRRRDTQAIAAATRTLPALLSRDEQGRADANFTALHDEATRMLMSGEPIPRDARVLPMTAMPAVLQMLGAPNQIVAMDTAVLEKLRVKDVDVNGKHGHAKELAKITPAEMNRIMREPAIVFYAGDNEYELVSDVWGDSGPLLMVIKTNVSEAGDSAKFAKVMTVYSRPVGDVNTRLRQGTRKLVYFDPAKYPAVIGKVGAPDGTVISQDYAGRTLLPPTTRGARQPTGITLDQQQTAQGSVGKTMPSTPDYVRAKLQDKSVKSWIDVVKFIGDRYTGPLTSVPRSSPRRNFTLVDPYEFIPPGLMTRVDAAIKNATQADGAIAIPDEARAKATALLQEPLRKAREAKAEFDAKLEKAAPGNALWLAPVKSLGSAVRKLVLEYNGTAVDNLQDLVRATVVVDSYDEVQGVIDGIHREFTVTRIKNRTDTPFTARTFVEEKGFDPVSGYGDVLVNVALPSGVQAEIQISTPEMISAKEAQGHLLYEVARVNPQQHARVMALSREYYSAARGATEARKRSSVENMPLRGVSRAGTNVSGGSSRNTLPSGNLTKSSPPIDSKNTQPSGNLSGTFIKTSALEKRAKQFAAKAHGRINQRRKFTGEPYIVHPASVADIVRSVDHTDEMLAAAWLHDVVEDTDVTLGTIRRAFGDKVADLVRELHRESKKEQTPAKTVKLADIIDNVKDVAQRDPEFARVYLAEKKVQLGELQGGDPKLMARAMELIEEGLASLKPLASTRRRSAEVPPQETLAAKARRITGDSMKRFEVLEKWGIERGAVPGNENSVYTHELATPGRIAARVSDFREKRVAPLVKRAQKAGIPLETLAQFLHAQHAEERNQRIAAINPLYPDGGSGMPTATARDILAQAKNEAYYPELLALADEVRAIANDTKRILLDAGIISQDTVDAWESAYKFYVPLRGGPEDGAQTGAGKGLSVNGKQKRALGHGVRDEFIIEHVLRGYERAVHMAERNRVGTVLVKWLKEINNPNVGTVAEPEKRGVLRPGDKVYAVYYHGSLVDSFASNRDAHDFINDESLAFGRAREDFSVHVNSGDPQVVYMARPMLDANEVAVYENGEMIRVQLNDELLSRAYQRMGTEPLGKVLGAARDFNAYLSMMYTGRNPEFILTNMLRDFLAAPANLTGEYGADVAARAVAYYPKALFDMLRYQVTGKAAPILDQYRLAGGSTGAAWLTDLERLAKDVGVAYADYQGAVSAMVKGRPGKATWIAGRKLVKALTFWIEHLNAATENAMRLAAYEAVLKKTNDDAEAVRAAKNVTVNFNKKGELSGQLSAIQLFYNPTVQGSYTIYHALTKGKHKHQLQAAVATLATLGYLASMMGDGDDDDDGLAGVSKYEKTRNIIIPLGNGLRLNIPMPYGYSWFYNLGQYMYDLQKDGDISAFSLHSALSFQDNFAPVKAFSEDGFHVGELMPTEPAKMLLRLDTNRSSFGSQIYPENVFDPGMPDSAKMYRNTVGGFYDNLTRSVNELTGGSETQPGAIDVSPETLRFWWNSLTGGAGAFVESSAAFTRLLASEPGAIEPRDIPVVRKFVKSANINELRSRYYDALQKAHKADADLKRAWAAEDVKGEKIATERGKAANEYYSMLAAQRDYLKALNMDRLAIMRSDFSVGEKRLRLKSIEAEEAEVYKSVLMELPENLR